MGGEGEKEHSLDRKPGIPLYSTRATKCQNHAANQNYLQLDITEMASIAWKEFLDGKW